MKHTKNKQFWEMSVPERTELTKEFDKEFVKTYPLMPAMRAQWKRAKRKPGRPKIGKGAKSVLISVEQDLLKNADAFARRNKLSRSQLIAGLLRTLPKAG